MNIVQLTPGAGPMFCGNCFRDNALVSALRKLGHEALMVPLYLPLTLDEKDQSADTPIFFSGINVYLQQKSPLFRQAPAWLRNLFASRPVLQWAAGKAARTRAQDLGDLTLSMLRGEQGNQARDLDELIKWLSLAQQQPDIICLSNALLVGFARRLKTELQVPVICTLQGEDTFLDSLPPNHRAECWQTLSERAADISAFIAPSHYFAKLMSDRLSLPASRVHVVHNGIDLSGFQIPSRTLEHHSSKPETQHPVLGYFARMCREKGLDQLVEAFISLRQRGRIKHLKLHVGGSCGPADEPFVGSLRDRLNKQNLLADVEFHPNLDRAAKLAFLRRLSVFSVPALYGEAFGLYLIEAMAAGVPVVQPQTAAFPELVHATDGGILCAPGDPEVLADAIENLLSNPERRAALGRAGALAVFENFSAESMARRCLHLFAEVSAATSASQSIQLSNLNPQSR